MFMYGTQARRYGFEPKKGYVDRIDDRSGRYSGILIYDRLLTDKEVDDFKLDFVGLTYKPQGA